MPSPACQPSTKLKVETLRATEALEPLAGPWNQLAGPVVFRRWEWLASWWHHYQPRGAELLVLTVRDTAGELVAIAPWYLNRSAWQGGVIRMLGSGDVCSDYLTIFCQPAWMEPAIDRIAETLAEETAFAWDALELEAVERDDPSVARLEEQMSARGLHVARQSTISSWRIELPATWDEYVMTLSKSRRERVRQLWRRQFDTQRARVRWVERPKEIEPALAILVDLHQRRRATMGDCGYFASPQALPFLREVAQRFLELGQLRFQIVELEGRPVAVEFDLAGDDAVYYYQSGVDPDVIRQRPGWLGNMAAIRRAIEDGYRYFDFLRGDEPYKQHWRAERVPLVNLRVAARGLTSGIYHQAWWAKHNVKQRLKQYLRKGETAEAPSR